MIRRPWGLHRTPAKTKRGGALIIQLDDLRNLFWHPEGSVVNRPSVDNLMSFFNNQFLFNTMHIVWSCCDVELHLLVIFLSFCIRYTKSLWNLLLILTNITTSWVSKSIYSIHDIVTNDGNIFISVVIIILLLVSETCISTCMKM